MIFQERTYSVLLVSAVEKFNMSMKEFLPMTDYWPVRIAKNAAEARRLALEGSYDIVIINSPLPDEFGSRLAIDICSDSNSGVLLFVKNDSYDEVYAKVMEYGVLAISKPTNAPMITQSLRTLCTICERMKKVEEKQASIEEKIEEIRVVNHAKWLLIDRLKFTEPEAQKYIEKNAMDLRISKKEMATHIIKTYE